MYKIYSRKECGYCRRAKDLLDMLGEDYIDLNLDIEDNHKELMAKLPSARTIPQIWHGEDYIGGYTELVEYTK